MLTRSLLFLLVFAANGWCQQGDHPPGSAKLTFSDREPTVVPADLDYSRLGETDRSSFLENEPLVQPEVPVEQEQRILDFGGSYRARYHRETNMRPGSTGGLSGLDDSFWLHQTRLWVDGQLSQQIQFRLGFMDAASFGEDFLPRGNEVNRHDLYQAYVDFNLGDSGTGSLKTRVGRQEIRLGSDRLMMAPGWANRRRSHDGVRFIWNRDGWETSSFWVRPALRNRTSFSRLDIPDPDQQIYGLFSTYKVSEKNKFEIYWLAYDLVANAEGARYDTIGSRLLGEQGNWSYEIEGGIQLGVNPDETDHQAGFFTGGVGRKLQSLVWDPEIWLFFDWASGSETTGNGFHTYVQRAHYFLGFMDLFGRRNLEDLNVRFSVKPLEKLTFLTWCHFFSLADGRDVPYNVNMKPYAGLEAGDSGSQTLGTELDFLLTYDFDEKTQVRFGYSYFWSGSFYRTTADVPFETDANFLYSHFLYRF